MSGIMNISRRDFLKTSVLAGGGLLLGVRLSSGKDKTDMPGDNVTFMPNAFIRVGTDGVVTIIVNKSEMGQGVYTSLPMLVAEELEVDWKTVRIEAAPVDHAYDHTQWGPLQGTGGSTSVRSEWDRLSQMGAAAREMLIAAAAATWKMDKKECRAENSTVVGPGGKKLSYGELAGRAADMPVPQDVPLKDPAQYDLLGKPVRRLDTPAKTDGTARFGMDAGDKGVLVAVVARCPVFGGKLKSFKADKTKTMAGVHDVVQIDSGVAVVADGYWTAMKGRDALEMAWDEGPLADLDSAQQLKRYADMAKTPGAVAHQEGDASKALSEAAASIQAEYHVPYLAHATMEPMNAVADVRPDGCDIWAGTQFQTIDRDAAARITGLPPEKVKLHTQYLGGGFGRRACPGSDFVSEAVQVSKAVKKPVKLIWTREDDTKGGWYRPAFYDRIAAGLDKDGNPIAWKHTIVGQSIISGTAFEEAMVKDGIDETSVEGAKDMPYKIPNIKVELHSPKLEVPVLWWRSVGHSHTAFVVETFIDELAYTAGRDPYEFRRGLLMDYPRHKGVLELVARKAGWGGPVPRGRGRGIAVHHSFGSFIAQVAEVSVSPAGKVRVHKVVCAIDCGKIVNPDTIEAQMESGIVFGLSAALFGKITFKNGRVEQSNFHDYELVRMKDMPEVEVHIMPSQEAPGGVGEPGVPPIAPAVANAIFAVTGKRVRELPIDTEKLKKA